MSRIYIADCTLNEICTENSCGLLFREKLEIATCIDRYGADVIELAPLKNTKGDIIVAKTIASSVKNAVVSVPAIASCEDFKYIWDAVSCAVHPRLKISLPVSTVQMEYQYRLKETKMLVLLQSLIEKGLQYFKDVEFEALDATRADRQFLLEACKTACSSGVSTITVCDDAGIFMPDQISTLVSDICSTVSLPVFVKVSDSIGLGNANALYSLKSGATGIKASVCGKQYINLDSFASLLRANESTIGVESNLVYTELHSDIESMLCSLRQHYDSKNSFDETKDPGAIFIDASSTRQQVSDSVTTLGYDISEDDISKVYDAIKHLCESKSSIGGKELEAVIASSAMQVPSTFSLESYTATISNKVKAVANIVLVANGSQISGVATGDGIIDASFRAIEQCIGHHYELDDFQIQAVTEGREALGSALVRLRSNGKLYSGNGLSPDICGASIQAYINALNKIAYEEAKA